jgi:hypothetical protein
MPPDVSRYFADVIFPLLEECFADLLPEAMLVVEGSVGLALHDEWSDLDATIYLNDPLWEERGSQLQLALMHDVPAFSPRSEPHCSFPGQPHLWAVTGHPEICVHPFSWLLDHQALAFLGDEREAPWESISIQRLYALQHDLVLRDPQGTLAKLRAASSVERYPEWLWRRQLILRLHGLKGEPWDLEKAAARGKPVEATTILGPLVQALIEVCFLVQRRYYPWRKHLWQALEDLEIAADVGSLLAEAATAPSWNARADAVNEVVTRLADAAIASGLLTRQVLEHLHFAKSGEAWSNPDWLAEYRRYAPLAQQAGYDEQDGWVWCLWKWA